MERFHEEGAAVFGRVHLLQQVFHLGPEAFVALRKIAQGCLFSVLHEAYLAGRLAQYRT